MKSIFLAAWNASCHKYGHVEGKKKTLLYFKKKLDIVDNSSFSDANTLRSKVHAEASIEKETTTTRKHVVLLTTRALA